MPKNDQKGFLITFEGMEGAGKTTNVNGLKEKLEALGKKVIDLREPGGTSISEQIREVVLSPKNKEMDFTTEVLLFQAARAQIYGEVILPALKAGKVVVMDRSRDSSLIYQGMVRGFGKELIESLNDISTKETLPDLTILLDVEVETGLRRRMESGKVDRLDMEGKKFHDQVRAAYLKVAQEDKTGRWAKVDAEQPLEKVEKAVWEAVKKKFGL